MRISHKATGLVAGLYQRWRTAAHCTQPDQGIFCSWIQKTLKNHLIGKKAIALFKNST